jgi:hypothetical protein
MNISMVSYAVRSSDGSVDVDGTVAKFTTDLCKYVVAQAADEDRVISECKAVFAEFPLLPAIQSSVLANIVCSRITANPGEVPVVMDRISTVIHNRPDTFAIARGRNGGVSLVKSAPKS